MITGKVEQGSGKGRLKYNHPTANLDCKRRDIKLKQGIYAGVATLENKKYEAALVIRDEPFKVEVHLINFPDINLFGKSIQVEPIQKVAEYEKYEDVDELKAKIAKDLKMVEDLLKTKSSI